MGEKKWERLSHCEILGVTKRATKAEIKYAYLRATEAYQYLLETKVEDDSQPSVLEPSPPLLKYEPFKGVNLKAPGQPKRGLLSFAAPIAVLLALIPQYHGETGGESVRGPAQVRTQSIGFDSARLTDGEFIKAACASHLLGPDLQAFCGSNPK